LREKELKGYQTEAGLQAWKEEVRKKEVELFQLRMECERKLEQIKWYEQLQSSTIVEN
jgi:hypothetical protein